MLERGRSILLKKKCPIQANVYPANGNTHSNTQFALNSAITIMAMTRLVPTKCRRRQVLSRCSSK